MPFIQRSLNRSDRKAVQNFRALGGRCTCNLFIIAYKFPYSRWMYTSAGGTPHKEMQDKKGPLWAPDWVAQSVFRNYGISAAAMVEGLLVTPEASTLSTM